MEHKNITRILNHGSDGTIVSRSGKIRENQTFILFEYLEGGSLFNLFLQHGTLGEEFAHFFMYQIVDVMCYMHTQKIVHRDLKPENILIDDNLNVKLCDFGFSTFKNIQNLRSYRGTKTYMAPEIIEGKLYDGRKSDVFSIGVIMFMLVVGSFPFKTATNEDFLYNLIIEDNESLFWEENFGNDFSDNFRDLVYKMFSYDPKKRLTIQEVRKHPWM